MAPKQKPDTKAARLDTEPYKGVRDLYPDDMAIQNYLFGTMREVAERFGYVEFGASVLEKTELYEAKTGEEIVNEQMYTFMDKGDRRVSLRPEMTPTVARMIAAKRRELAFPLRWYSIPNLFRYERPQRGRLREHWQLNVDLFGVANIEADIEIMAVAYALMRTFGATDDMFVIRINSRAFMEHVFDFYSLSEEERHGLAKLIDRKHKVEEDRFLGDLHDILKDKADLHDIFARFIGANDMSALAEHCLDSDSKRELDHVMENLAARGVANAELDVSVMRGFDYYTGVVFEIFDTSPENNRSLFGGGRYDDLLALFGEDPIPAVGFGMGDVTLHDFLKTHDLLPEVVSPTDLYICILDENAYSWGYTMANELRRQGINVAVDLSGKKVKDQVKTASKLGIPFVVCIGENEVNSNTFVVKNMQTGKEETCESVEAVASQIFG